MYAFKKPNCNAAREKTQEERKKNYYNQKQFHKDKKQNTFPRSCIQIEVKTVHQSEMVLGVISKACNSS